MKHITAILLFTIFTSISGLVYGQSNKSISVKLRTEKKVSNTGIRVKFLEMVEDSRCPRDTNCIWAGNAKIRLEVAKGSRSQIIELNTNTPNRDNRFGGYEFRITSLTPEPRSNIRINPSGYVAVINITAVR
jgi:hypothetical protein